MSERSVHLRAAAAADIDAAADYYLAEAGGDVALRFVDAVERVLDQIARSPQAGSLRFAYELDIPDLRARPLTRFPYLVFYVIAEERIEVWRVLHVRRDVASEIATDAAP